MALTFILILIGLITHRTCFLVNKTFLMYMMSQQITRIRNHLPFTDTQAPSPPPRFIGSVLHTSLVFCVVFFFFSYLRSVSGAQCRLFPCPLFITLSVFLHVYIPLEYEIRMVVVILSYVVDNSRLLGSPTTLQNLLSVSFVYFC